MKGLTRKYLLLIVLFCGWYTLPTHRTGDDVFSSSEQTTRHYSRGRHHHSAEKPFQEIVEHAPDSFQKDLAGDAVFRLLCFHDFISFYLNLLSERLSLQKPFLITHFNEDVYLLIRILRL